LITEKTQENQKLETPESQRVPNANKKKIKQRKEENPLISAQTTTSPLRKEYTFFSYFKLRKDKKKVEIFLSVFLRFLSDQTQTHQNKSENLKRKSTHSHQTILDFWSRLRLLFNFRYSILFIHLFFLRKNLFHLYQNKYTINNGAHLP
jgi:hypothetical protein